jgi:uncharacterized protein (DUF885 family)
MPTSFLRGLLLAGAVSIMASACDAPPPSQDQLAQASMAALATIETAGSVAAAASSAGPGAFPDYSIAAAETVRAFRLQRLAEAERVDASRVSPPTRKQFEAARISLAAAVRLDRHGFGSVGLGAARPYLITPENGAYFELVRFMIEQQPVRDRASADAWLQRLALVGEAVRQETVRFEADLAAGVSPPASLVDQTLIQVRALSPANPDAHPLLLHFSTALQQIADIAPEERVRMMDEARVVLAGDLAPAMDRLAEALTRARSAAPEIGLWRLPRGEPYYADLLHLYCDTDLPPAEVHALAQTLIKQQAERLNDLLAGMGRAEGTAAERLTALAAEPDQRLVAAPEAPAPIEPLLANLIRDLRERTSRMTRQPVPDAAKIVLLPSVPVGGALPATARALELEGATLEVDASALDRMALFQIPTLLAREVSPGRQLLQSVAAGRADRGPLDGMTSFPAFEEGWASYAEDLAGEAGAHDGALAARAGYYQARLKEAALLASDTGVHHLKWSRADTAAFLQATAAMTADEAERSIDAILLRPAETCAPALGRERLRQLRVRTETALGSGFSVQAFNDLVLEGGPRPMALVEQDVNAAIDLALTPAPAEPAPAR